MIRRFELTIRDDKTNVTRSEKKKFATTSLHQKVYALAKKDYTSFELLFEFEVEYSVLYISNQ